MKYLILSIILAALSSFVGTTPVFADSGAGVSVTLTTTIIGGSSSGSSGGYGGYGGYCGGDVGYGWVTPYTSQDNVSVSMPSVPEYNLVIEPQQEWQPIADTTLSLEETAITPETSVDNEPQVNIALIVGIALSAIIIGIGAWLLWVLFNRRKANKQIDNNSC